MLTLDKLPHLQVLKLKQNSYSGRKLACVCSCGFPELKVLHLKSICWLEEWTIGAGAMPKLGSIIVNPCAYLRKLPEELWCIKSFCKLDLHWPQPELRQNLRALEDMEQQYDIQLYPYGIWWIELDEFYSSMITQSSVNLPNLVFNFSISSVDLYLQ